jgi:hypothetical protein
VVAPGGGMPAGLVWVRGTRLFAHDRGNPEASPLVFHGQARML